MARRARAYLLRAVYRRAPTPIGTASSEPLLRLWLASSCYLGSRYSPAMMPVISPKAKLTIRHLPIRRLVIDETRARSLDWVAHYTRLLLSHPDWDTGVLC